MSNKKYEPCQLFSWWSWYWYGEPGTIDESHLPRELFDLLRGGKPYEYYRRDYPTREEALADLAQAQQALKAQEEQTVTAEKTQGEPIELGKVLPGDVVRLERTYPSGFTETFSGPVSYVANGHIVFSLGEGHTTAWGAGKCDRVVTITLLHRPPRRREISKDDLILKTPIGTRITLVNSEGGETEGTLQVAGRDGRGFGVYLGPNISSTIRVDLDNIKAIYTEEVQS